MKQDKKQKKIALIGIPELIGEGLKIILSDINILLSSSDKVNLSQFGCAIISENRYFEDIEFWSSQNIIILRCSTENDKDNDNILTLTSTKKNIISKVLRLIEKNESHNDSLCTLSLREIDVIREIASGKTFKEIAEKLNISVNTVVTHRKNISSKLGIRSTSGLSVYALMNKLV